MSKPPPPEADPSLAGWSEAGSASGDPLSFTPIAPAEPDRYRVGALLGRGGMGAVWTARDRRLGREVAYKEPLPERADDALTRARLAREAAVTSRLDHPGILPVYDVGEQSDGRPFYVMRLVRGRTLAQLAEGLDAEARPRLVRHLLAAAEAVAAAHRLGLVHRDLKPANILIGEHGETQVADWGLAAPTPAMARLWADLPGPTPTGRLGTPPFASPEQERGEPPDPRDDVWSLGVCLDALLGEAAPAELRAVIEKARHPRREGRYADAGELAAELLRWFEGRRVQAHAYSPRELAARFLRAWRLPLAVAAVGVLGVGLALALGWWRSEQALARALIAEEQASARLAEVQLQQAVAAAEELDRESAERLALAVLERGEDPLARGVLAAFGRAERPRLLAEAPGPACEWSALPPEGDWLLCGGAGGVTRWQDGQARWRRERAVEGGRVQAGAGGRLNVLLWDAEGGGELLDAETGETTARLPRRPGDWELIQAPRAIWAGSAPLDPVAMPPSGCEGRLVAAAGDGDEVAVICQDGSLLLARPEGEVLRLPTEARGDHVATAIARAPTGDIVLGTLRGRVLILSPRTGETRALTDTPLGAVRALAISSDGRHLAVDGDRGVGLLRLDTAALLTTLPARLPRAIGFSAQGLVVHDGDLRTWSIPSGAPVVLPAGVGLADLAVAPAGDRIALVGGGGLTWTVDLADGSRQERRLGQEVVKAVAWGPRGPIASGMGAPWLAIDTPEGRLVPPGARALRRLAPWGEGLVGLDLERGAWRWTALDAPPAALFEESTFLDLEADEEALVLLDREGRVLRLDGTGVRTLRQQAGARAVALRGERLALATAEGAWLVEGAGARLFTTGGARILDLSFDATGEHLAAGTLEGRIFVWRADGRLLGELPGHQERVVAVEFLPDGDLASASWDKTARLWSMAALRRPLPTPR